MEIKGMNEIMEMLLYY